MICRRCLWLVLPVLGACASPPPPPRATPATPVEPAEPTPAGFAYPDVPRGDTTDDYHGVSVADPYRWLEDLDSDETQKWVGAQNQLTFGYLASIPEREAIRRRLTALWNYERYGLPEKHGDRYFIERNDGLQNQDVLYWTDRLDGELRPLLDPNTLSEDGTVALAGLAIDKTGQHVAYGLSESGSDWEQWRVRDVATGKDLDDHLRWVKFSDVSWTKDGAGFFYSRYAEPESGEEFQDVNYHQKLYFHRLGDPQSADRLVYQRQDKKEWGFNGHVTDDGEYLVVTVRVGTDPKSGLFYQDLGRKGDRMVELLNEFDARYVFVANRGPVFWVRTDLGAARGRLVAIDTRAPERSKWKEVIPESAETLLSVDVVGDRFIAHYLKDAHSQVKVYRLDGTFEREIELNGIGSVSGFKGERDDTETFYSFMSYTTPSTIYRYDVKAGKSTLFRAPKVDFDPADYETEQVFFRSKDGTRVPMFITAKRGLPRGPATPTYLYGYGGFNISQTPKFSVPTLVWLEMGGVLAVPNLRGGGEYGEAWHRAGTRHDKQNVFDDFIAAAEWLIAEGRTSKDKLAIGGRSNGGLLVGAAMTQRPDLFAAALPGVGVMDMLRFDKFTIGWAWVSDYGSPGDAADFAALRAYSPYHNIREGVDYPATLAYTADHDDRVVPGHTYKFISQLQHAHAGDDPVLVRIDVKAGHGAGKPTTKIIEEYADLWGFLVDNLDMEVAIQDS